ncbi:hypothetical protein TNCV_2063371 [Trichonephila clavipes]|nr:hypothetical protein TNCV_2063371 [Trichonephila clavipes]
MNPDDIHKTAICTPFGLFESTRMQFGLCGASATFQRFIDEVTRNLEGVYAFVDNILIASRDPEEHHKHLKALFSRLHEYGLSINVSKCVFGVSKIDFLGFHLSEEAFRLAKNAIAEAALLRHPIPGASLSIWVDASDVAIGGTLMQLSKNQWEPIAFFSMKLNKSQQKWSTYDRELFSIYSTIRKFRYMLEGRTFQIYTDQKPLIYAFKQKVDKCSPRQMRHLDFIAQYSTDIRHVQGNKNIVADALSRIKIDSITQSHMLNFRAFAEAQTIDSELQQFLHDSTLSLHLELKPCQISDHNLICDTSTGTPRPFVPTTFRKLIFEHLHNLSHPGIAATTKLICSRYVWPCMKKTNKNMGSRLRQMSTIQSTEAHQITSRYFFYTRCTFFPHSHRYSGTIASI